MSRKLYQIIALIVLLQFADGQDSSEKTPSSLESSPCSPESESSSEVHPSEKPPSECLHESGGVNGDQDKIRLEESQAEKYILEELIREYQAVVSNNKTDNVFDSLICSLKKIAGSVDSQKIHVINKYLGKLKEILMFIGRFGDFGSSEEPPKDCPASENPPSEAPPCQSPPSQNPPSQNPPSENPPSENPPSQNPPSQNPPSQNPPSQNPPSQNPPSQNPPSQNPPSENPPSENPPSENPPSENPPSQNPPSQNPPSQNPPTEGPFCGSPTEVPKCVQSPNYLCPIWQTSVICCPGYTRYAQSYNQSAVYDDGTISNLEVTAYCCSNGTAKASG
jgi:hypothetical protein